MKYRPAVTNAVRGSIMRGVTVFFRQTPAGERVPLARLMAIARSGEFASPLLKGWNAFGSGSMALAAALFFASSRDKPRTCVLLPAYSCPDIVAASLAVGLEPVFVDLADDQTGMDLAALHGRQSADRSICVLVDLFGTQHAMPTRGSLASNSPITLIHDRAQSLAGPGLAEDSSADLVVVSRGRGKPATLLGGGATWARQAEAFTSFSATHFPLGNWSIAGTMLRAALYNLATQPVIFGTAARLPFLHIGETRLRELPAITRLPPTWLVHAARQLRACQSTRAAHCSRTLAMADLIPADGFRIPADALQTAAREGLNRLPVICKDAEQAQWLAGRGRSLGVSSMYGKTLPEFMGMSPADAALAFPVAHRFSRTLVTLPTHLRCGPRTRQSLRKLFHDAR